MSMINATNTLTFGQPIVQTQTSMGGDQGGGNQQNLNLSWNIPITTGVPLAPSIPPQFTPAPPQQPIMMQPAAGAIAGAGAGAFPGVGGFPGATAGASAGAGAGLGSLIPPVVNPLPAAPQQAVQPASPYLPMPFPQYIPQMIPQYLPMPMPYPVPDMRALSALQQSQAQAQAQAQSQSQGSSEMNDFLAFILLLALVKSRKGGSAASDSGAGTSTASTGSTGSTSTPPPPPPPPPPPAPPQTVKVNDAVVPGGQQKIQQIAKTGSPLTLDLNGDGVKTAAEKIRYDIDGDGVADTINNFSKGDAMLVFDADKNGISGENGKEVFGDNTDLNNDGKKDGFKDGFDALRALADEAKRRGLINNDDYLDASELAVLEQAYGLKAKVGGFESDAISLVQAGVSGINLATGEKQLIKNFDGQGNDTVRQNGATFTRADGSIGVYEDIFYAYGQTA